MRTYGSLIGYKEINHISSSTFSTINPKTNHSIDNQFIEATLDDVQKAAELAKNALFSYTKSDKKTAFLSLIAEKLEHHRKDLIENYCLESGLSESRGNVELNRTIFQLQSFSKLIETENWETVHFSPADENRTPSRKPQLTKKRMPIGVVAVFGASNFPFAYSTVGGDTAAALAAGCPVIVKCHPFHAETSCKVARLVNEAIQELELPEGTFSHLLASDYIIGEELIKHPNISAVGFTGSIKGGLALQKLAQNRTIPIPVFAEMGSQNPVFILENYFESEPLISLSKKLISSITQSSGQFCTQPGVIFIPSTENGNLLVNEMKSILNEQPIEAMLHPNIYKNFKTLTELIGRQENVSQTLSIYSTKLENQGRGILTEMNFETYMNNPIFHQEIFGPHSFIVRYDAESELTQFIQKTEGQLTISIFTQNSEQIINEEFLFECQLKSGRIIFNGVPTGVEVDPAMQHGGPFPSSSDSRFTAVGTDSIERFTRKFTFQE
jgi:alpha-ketoglutaric semialdehyde dehydrogenase